MVDQLHIENARQALIQGINTAPNVSGNVGTCPAWRHFVVAIIRAAPFTAGGRQSR